MASRTLGDLDIPSPLSWFYPSLPFTHTRSVSTTWPSFSSFNGPSFLLPQGLCTRWFLACPVPPLIHPLVCITGSSYSSQLKCQSFRETFPKHSSWDSCCCIPVLLWTVLTTPRYFPCNFIYFRVIRFFPTNIEAWGVQELLFYCSLLYAQDLELYLVLNRPPHQKCQLNEPNDHATLWSDTNRIEKTSL